MCLILGRYSEITIRGQDTVVYKKLTYHSATAQFMAPYRGNWYRKGELKEERYFSDDFGNKFRTRLPDFPDSLESNGVYKGLHAYQDIKPLGGSSILVECVIPAGTPFIRGIYGDIVSLKLKVGRAIKGKQEFINTFNSQKPTNQKKPFEVKAYVVSVLDKIVQRLECW